MVTPLIDIWFWDGTLCTLSNTLVGLDPFLLIMCFLTLGSGTQDDKTFSLLRKTLGSFLDTGSDEDFPADDWNFKV